MRSRKNTVLNKAKSILQRSSRTRKFLENWRIFGLKHALVGRRSGAEGGNASHQLLRVYPRNGLSGVLYARSDTSDLDVFRQIFCQHELDLTEQLNDVHLIVDAGANVGYSTLYLMQRFPDASIIAIEPDPENYKLLQLNTRAFRDKIFCLNAALWSHSGIMQPAQRSFRDGLHWSRQFVPSVDQTNASNTVDSVTLDEVLKIFSWDSVDLLKMDIEGAEAELFRCPGQWIGKTRAMLVEVHDDSAFGDARASFHKATEIDFDISVAGEKLFAVRKT